MYIYIYGYDSIRIKDNLEINENDLIMIVNFQKYNFIIEDVYTFVTKILEMIENKYKNIDSSEFSSENDNIYIEDKNENGESFIRDKTQINLNNFRYLENDDSSENSSGNENIKIEYINIYNLLQCIPEFLPKIPKYLYAEELTNILSNMTKSEVKKILNKISKSNKDFNFEFDLNKCKLSYKEELYKKLDILDMDDETQDLKQFSDNDKSDIILNISSINGTKYFK